MSAFSQDSDHLLMRNSYRIWLLSWVGVEMCLERMLLLHFYPELYWSEPIVCQLGMLPHKTKRGQAALERLKVFDGIPPPYDKVTSPHIVGLLCTVNDASYYLTLPCLTEVWNQNTIWDMPPSKRLAPLVFFGVWFIFLLPPPNSEEAHGGPSRS